MMFHPKLEDNTKVGEVEINTMSSLAMRDEFSGDFSTIEEMDPSVADGFRVIYDREVRFIIPTTTTYYYYYYYYFAPCF